LDETTDLKKEEKIIEIKESESEEEEHF